uniref:NADH-ubiquinone oxidoreductase chain 2 n=1 Tax=Astropecten polyacanthus TaxID=60560 RepID=Q5KSQ7_ASTPO|nr:NADH dehydrogenase subunit 2 [Astropecten polyacanthus]BAD86696.1 NADH dehydrogenase subunit 2 [Astropecten polyacanthus]
MNRSLIVLLILNVIVSTLVVVSSHHWFTLWVGLEMNTLSILPILSYQFSPRGVESTVKYFLVQSVSAAMILNAVLVNAWFHSSWSIGCPLGLMASLVLSIAVGLKLGLFPCHYWFPDVVQGVGFIQGLVLSTWQKVAPFVVLIYIINELNSSLLVIAGALSVFVGGWGGLNQTQVRKILAFSSIAHIGWICSVVCFSSEVSLVMFVIYVFINSMVFLISNELSLVTLSSISRLIFYNSIGGFFLILGALSLGGLPPLTGFLIKFLALECLIQNGSLLNSCLLVIGSLISLFFYLRIAFNSSLVFFPQHSLVMFSWRSVGSNELSFHLYGGFLSFLVAFSVFGLVFSPLIISLFNI